MGQFKALLYKSWKITTRQKGSLVCQVVTPVLCLVIILIIKLLTTDLVKDVQKDRNTKQDAIPKFLYFANVPWLFNLLAMNNTLDHATIFDYGVSNKVTSKSVEDMFQNLPWLFRGLETSKPKVGKPHYSKPEKIKTPIFRRNEYTDVIGMGDKIGKNLQALNKLNINEIIKSQIVGDGYLFFESIEDKKIKLHASSNGIIFGQYHRQNGISQIQVQNLSLLFPNTTAQNESDRTEISYPIKKSSRLLLQEKDIIQTKNDFTNRILAYLKSDLEYVFDSKEEPDNEPVPKKKEKQKKARRSVVPTEGMITLMNTVANSQINTYFISEKNKEARKNIYINTMVAPLIGSSDIGQLIDTVLLQMMTGLFPVAMSMGFPMLLFALVMEKEEGVRELMTINGLKTVWYWICYYIYYFIILSIVSVFFVLLGWVMIDMPYFKTTSILVQILMLSIWNITQISWGLLISTFIKSSRIANLVGYMSSIFICLVFGGINEFLFGYPQNLPVLFYIIPHVGMLRSFYQMSSICQTDNCVRGFGDIDEELGRAMIYMLAFGILYGIIGLLQNEPLLLNRLKCRKSKKRVDDRNTGQSFETYTDDLSEISNSGSLYVNEVKQLDGADPDYVQIAKDLSKTYSAKKDKKAQDNFNLSVERGQVFGLLGPNGAGKTTFQKILTGTETSDTGEAYIGGVNVNQRAGDNIKVGFCPQFDIVWPMLTVDEHLIFFHYFKDVPTSDVKGDVQKLIKNVNLEEDYEKLASQLSGGMKRRLSLAISLCGSPEIVLLDEPSSGLDPVKRRNFWDLILEVAKQRAVQQTTHLMEEADTLSERIAIITEGRLRCFGTPSSLKNTFGGGYKLQIVLNKVSKETEEELANRFIVITNFLQDHIKNIAKTSSFQRTINYVIPSENVKLNQVFSLLKNSNNQFADWSISQGSLEDVFINVVRKYRKGDSIMDEV